MTRRPSTFRKRDLTRAIQAAAASGVPVARISVDKTGRIDVIFGQPAHNAPPQSNDPNPWDAP